MFMEDDMARFIIGILTLVALAMPVMAGESGDFEVHEWGYVCINIPAKVNQRDAFLKDLPGKIRQVTQVMPDGRTRVTPTAAPYSPPVGLALRPSASGGVPTGQPNDPTNVTPPTGRPGSGTNDNPDFIWARHDPFIWFHSNRPIQVKLDVKLGINKPFCWWPQGLDEGNNIRWKKLLVNRSPVADKRPSAFEDGSAVSAAMNAARDVKASYVTAGNKVDRFLMYEFMGLCWSELRVKGGERVFYASNEGERPIRGLFLLPEGLGENQAYFAASVEPGADPRKLGDDAPYTSMVDLRVKLAEVLEGAGLNRDEALCMIKTILGFDDFMKSPGLKAMYLLDSRSIGEISTLEIEPRPAVMKRVWLSLVWDADKYDGLGPILRDSDRYAKLLENIRKSGATSEEIESVLRRLENMRSRG